MVQPIEEAINWFLALMNVIPSPFKYFIGLSFLLFVIAATIRLLYGARS